MKSPITMFDRIVLESLLKKAKGVKELCWDVGLPESTIFHSTTKLLRLQLLECHQGIFKLTMRPLIQDSRQIQEEVAELSHCLIKASWGETLKLKKVLVGEHDYKVINSLLFNFNSLLDEVHKRNLEIPHRTCQQQIFLWANAPYSDLLEKQKEI